MNLLLNLQITILTFVRNIFIIVQKVWFYVYVFFLLYAIGYKSSRVFSFLNYKVEVFL